MTNDHIDIHQQQNRDITEALYALREVQAIYRETMIIMREAEMTLHYNAPQEAHNDTNMR